MFLQPYTNCGPICAAPTIPGQPLFAGQAPTGLPYLSSYQAANPNWASNYGLRPLSLGYPGVLPQNLFGQQQFVKPLWSTTPFVNERVGMFGQPIVPQAIAPIAPVWSQQYPYTQMGAPLVPQAVIPGHIQDQNIACGIPTLAANVNHFPFVSPVAGIPQTAPQMVAPTGTIASTSIH